MGILVRASDDIARAKGWSGVRRRTVALADGSTKTFTFGRKPIEIPELYPEIAADRHLIVVQRPGEAELPVATAEETARILYNEGVRVGDILELPDGEKIRVIDLDGVFAAEYVEDSELPNGEPAETSAPSAATELPPLPENLDQLPVSELRELAKARGLDTMGNGAQILKRIRAWQEAAGSPPPAAGEEA